MDKRRPYNQLLIPRRGHPTIFLDHHLVRHAGIDLDVVKLVQPSESQVKANVRQVFSNAVSRPVTERPRHVPHLGRGVQPPLRYVLGRIGKHLGIAGGHVRRSRHLDALGDEVVADDFAGRYAREARAEGPPDSKCLLEARVQIFL